MEPEEYLVNEGQEVESPALDTEIQPEQEAKVESQVEEEPVAEVAEVVEVVDSKFVLKVGRHWFKSWSPFELCDRKSEAIILNADKARGYQSSIAMVKRLTATIIEI